MNTSHKNSRLFPNPEPRTPNTLAAIEVPLSLFGRHLGLPAGAELDERMAELAAETRGWYREHGAPWVYRRETSITEINGDTIRLACGTRLTSRLLAAGLEEAAARALVVVAISAGPEVDEEIGERWRGGRPDEALFLNAYAVAVTEHLRRREASELAALAARRRLAVLPHYSPGYEGWGLADQKRLYELIVEDLSGPSALPGPLHLLPSGALSPAKSTLAAFGVTQASLSGGTVAADPEADLPDYWVCRTTADRAAAGRQAEGNAALPSQDAPAYAFPESALEKWTKERLRVRTVDEDRLRARFRFDGTTCNNMGLLLQFDYEVELARKDGAYRILACSARPVDGDNGHRSMCAYMSHPERFMETVRAAPSGFGDRLDRVLHWRPETSPTGCLCTRGAQNHKWRIVLQTLHYALRKRGLSGAGETTS